MKFLNVLAAGTVILASTVALAYPKVGDKAGYNGSCKKGTEEKTWTLSKEVLLWVDADKKWVIKKDTMKDGGTKTELEYVADADMWSSAMWTDMMTNCVTKGGVMEDVTVPAGTYNTCHMMTTEDGKTKHMWWGDVPWGIVKKMKEDTAEGKTTTWELNSVTAAE
jgi:hypothetical protein